jgi:predicted GNAT superfamily acetyltransferase
MNSAQPTIRFLTPNDFEEVLNINNMNVPALGILSLEKLRYLFTHALHSLVVDQGTILGFCITFAPHAPYDSPNYQWFCNRYEQFIYLDRIAFVPDAQGLGLGKLLYRHIEHLMQEANLPYPLCCEVNLEPPNPGSLRFHQSIGFTEVGQLAATHDKRVCLLIKEIPFMS